MTMRSRSCRRWARSPGLMHSVHSDKAVRDTAQALLQKISQAGVELSLNRDVYQALDGINAGEADAATKHYLDRTLLQYRLAGVDKDDATRARIKELQDRITTGGLSFGRNVQEDGNTVAVEDASELEGLPPDYLETHKPGDGRKDHADDGFSGLSAGDDVCEVERSAAADVSGVQHAGVSGESSSCCWNC